MKLTRLVLWAVGLSVLALTLTSTALAAEAPKIAVAPIWRPAAQLTSVGLPTWTPGDDFRYADAEIWITTTVPFWAVQMTCTVTPTILEPYAWDDPNGGGYPLTGDWGDDQPMVLWGPEWGGEGNDFVQVPAVFNPTTGAMTITATSVGSGRWPLGANGESRTLLLATLRYRVRGMAGTSPFNCTGLSFLDRDGRPVITPTFTAPASLTVTAGYTITGKVTYQGRTSHTGIGVNCISDPDGAAVSHPAVTSLTGTFTITTRDLGWYDCHFFGNITNPASGYQGDKYLQAWTNFDMWSSSYNILPITLKGGNLDIDPTPSPYLPWGNQYIDSADIAVVTSNWNGTTAGDINGDLMTNKTDLAIVGGNLYEGEDSTGFHMIYDLPRVWQPDRDSRVWVGQGPWASEVTQLVPGTTKDYWATLSPDGKTLLFTRDVGGGRYALFKMPAAGGVAVRLTPTGVTWDAFAPSWSPDGQRIAFVCTDNIDAWFNRHEGTGSLCAIDASGRNFQFTGLTMRLFPPAWQGMGSSNVVVARPNIDWVSDCPANTLCMYDLSSGWRGELDTDIVVTGSQYADMPIISGDSLFYRFFNGIDQWMLRYARMDWSDGTPIGSYNVFQAPPAVRQARVHTDVYYCPQTNFDPACDGTYEPLTTQLDYYDVQTWSGGELTFNEINGWDWINAGLEFPNETEGFYPVWQSSGWNGSSTDRWTHAVTFQISNPWWEGDWAIGSDLHALRNTVDYVH